MKKLILTLVCLGLMAGSAFAADLKANILDTKLSTNVSGTYYVDGTLANYALSTGNDKGTKIYASGNFVSAIYEKNGTGTGGIYQTSDLLAKPSVFASSAFASGGTWTAK